MKIESQIVRVVITLTISGDWLILITKEHRSGDDAYEHTYTRHGGREIQHAMDIARQLVASQVPIVVDISE